jgi:hypothetical protein
VKGFRWTSQELTLPTICEAPFQEPVELFWLPSCLVTLLRRCGLTCKELTWSSARAAIKGKSFWFCEPNARLGELFSMIHDAGAGLPGVGLVHVNLL